MSRYPVVRVTWTDSTLAIARWEDRAQALARIDAAWSIPVETAGFLVSDLPARIVVCACDNADLDDVAQCVVIPRPAILDLIRWPAEP